MSAKLRVQRVAAGGLTFPDTDKEILMYLVWCTNHRVASGPSGKETYFNFFVPSLEMTPTESLVRRYCLISKGK